MQVRVLPPPLANQTKYNYMFKFSKRDKKDFKNFNEVSNYIEELEKKIEKLSQHIHDLKKQQKLNVQKVGIIRFNPFSDVGSDQSFSLALLDEDDNGVVITSLYTREENRVYGKPIKNGQSEYSLSDEEKKAIEKAKSPNNEK